LRTYRLLHSKGFLYALWNVRVGEVSLKCGLLRIPAGAGSFSPILYDFDLGDEVCRVLIPETEQGCSGDTVFHSPDDDLYLELKLDDLT